jgi:hypothetical protein
VERLPPAGRAAPAASAGEKMCWGWGSVRARAIRISNLASGRGGPRYCGGQPSGLKNGLSAPTTWAAEPRASLSLSLPRRPRRTPHCCVACPSTHTQGRGHPQPPPPRGARRFGQRGEWPSAPPLFIRTCPDLPSRAAMRRTRTCMRRVANSTPFVNGGSSTQIRK